MPKCSNDHRQGYSLRLRHLRAETVSRRLQASLWLSRRVGESQLPVVPAATAPPHVTLTVTRSGSPEGRPVMEASIAGIAALHDTDLLGQAPPRPATWSGASRGPSRNCRPQREHEQRLCYLELITKGG